MTNVDVVTMCTHPCTVCGETSILHTSLDRYTSWQNGAYAQEVFHDWDENKVELLISGTHPECWIILYGTEEQVDA